LAYERKAGATGNDGAHVFGWVVFVGGLLGSRKSGEWSIEVRQGAYQNALPGGRRGAGVGVEAAEMRRAVGRETGIIVEEAVRRNAAERDECLGGGGHKAGRDRQEKDRGAGRPGRLATLVVEGVEGESRVDQGFYTVQERRMATRSLGHRAVIC